MNLSACASWICKGNTKSPPTPTEHTMTMVQSGPGPSPGSSGSCDDIVPPPKNCYRLVVLGKLYIHCLYSHKVLKYEIICRSIYNSVNQIKKICDF